MCLEGAGGGVKSQNTKDSHKSQNLGESKNPTNSRESSESQKIFRFAQNDNFMLDCHESAFADSRNDSIDSIDSGESNKIFRLMPQNDKMRFAMNLFAIRANLTKSPF